MVDRAEFEPLAVNLPDSGNRTGLLSNLPLLYHMHADHFKTTRLVLQLDPRIGEHYRRDSRYMVPSGPRYWRSTGYLEEFHV